MDLSNYPQNGSPYNKLVHTNIDLNEIQITYYKHFNCGVY
jgi:hypothetical protein